MYSVFRKKFGCQIEAQIARFQGASSVLMVNNDFASLEDAVEYAKEYVNSGKHDSLVIKKEIQVGFDRRYTDSLVDVYWDENLLECSECRYPMRISA
jgi:hypothetical protein